MSNNAAASSSGSIGINGVEEMIGEGPAPPVTMTEAAAIIVAKQIFSSGEFDCSSFVIH